MAMRARPFLALDRFAARQFDVANRATTTVIDFDATTFSQRVNEVLYNSPRLQLRLPCA